MALITLKADAFLAVVASIKRWAEAGVEPTLSEAVETLTEDYKRNIRDGRDGLNVTMPDIKESTYNMPIRYGSDPAIRKDVNSSRKPLVARGDAVDSLTKKRTATGFEISPSTVHGNIVFSDNAFPKKNYRQKVTKTKRDPLVVSVIQERIIENAILKGLDSSIRI